VSCLFAIQPSRHIIRASTSVEAYRVLIADDEPDVPTITCRTRRPDAAIIPGVKKRLGFLGLILLIALAAMHEEVLLIVSPVRYWTWKLDDPNYRLQALGELKEVGAAAAPAAARVVQELGREETNVPDEARRVLVAIGEPAIPPLRAALSSSNEHLVAHAIGTLGRLGTPALPVLPEMVKAGSRVKNWPFIIHGGLARLTLGTDALRKVPDLDPGLARVICDEQRDTLSYALRRLPREEIEKILEVDPAAVKKLAALPPDEYGMMPTFHGDQVGCPTTGARFLRQDNRFLCPEHGPN
jgi:hypothetical protein